ncbi:hypothetical protein Tco_0285215 [Tanacetum coccineum]
MVVGNRGNQFRQYAGQNVRNQVVQNAVQNPGVHHVGNQNRLIVVPGIANQNGNGNVVATRAKGNANGNNGNQIRCYNFRGLGHLTRNYTVRPRRRDAAYRQTQLLIAQKEEAGIQLQAEEFDLMASTTDIDEIEETDKAPVDDSDGSVEVQLYENCYDNDIFNIFTQEEQYTELLEPIPEPHQVQQNESNNFEIQFLKEAVKFVRDFKSLAKEADESLAKYKALECKIERLLRAVVSQDIMSIVQNTPCVSNTLDPLPQKLQNENVELEFQVRNYEKENAHLKTAYKNLFNSINVTQAQTKMMIDSLQNKLHDTIYENAKLRAQLFDKVFEQKDTTKGTSTNTKFSNQSSEGKPSLQSLRNTFVVRQPNAFQSERPNFSKTRVPQKVDKTNDLSNPVTSNSVPTTKESKVVENDKVISPGMTNLITVSQPHVITKKVANFDLNGLSSTGVDNTAKTRRPQPRSNTKNDRVPSVSKSSCIKNKEVEVEEYPRNLLLSKNKKHMSSECNNVKLAIRNDKYEVVYAMCKQCLITANHDVCVINYVNGMNSRRKKQKAKVPNIANQTKLKLQVIQICLWCVDSGCSKHKTGNLKLLINFVWKFLGTVRFGNDHIAIILGFGDLQWGNILIPRVYFVEGLGHNLSSVGQFYESDLEVALRRNTCFFRNLEGVDLLKGNCTTNLYTINLHDMASASPIFLMARATSSKSWL